MNVKKALGWISRHKGALAKLLLSILALMIILFLPLRSETLLTLSIAPGALPDTATLVDNNTVAIAWGSTTYDPNSAVPCYSIPLNVSIDEFIAYGAKLSVEVDANVTVPDGQHGHIYIAVGGESGGATIASQEFSTALNQYIVSVDLSGTASYLDIEKAYAGSPPSDTMYVKICSDITMSGITGYVKISGGATVRKPVYTFLTEPIVSALSAIWGAVLGFIRRVRSVMNSALAGFWSFFGISAATGNVLLSIVFAALLLYIVHYKHLFKRWKHGH